jgi:hypothetical protein
MVDTSGLRTKVAGLWPYASPLRKDATGRTEVIQLLPLIDRDKLSADRFAHILAQRPIQPVVG